MFKINDGKVCGSNFSFDLPQGFNRVEGLDCFSVDDLVFGSADNKYLHVVIYFYKERQTARQDMQKMFDENSALIKLSDFIEVNRGHGTGIGVFYENSFGATQHYEERYDFKNNKFGAVQICIDISLYSGRGKNRQTIQNALQLPAVKAFLESLKYF